MAQRIRWQRHIVESSVMHRALLFKHSGDPIRWFGFLYFVVFECFSPLVETGGLVFAAIALWLGILSYEAVIVFAVLALGCAAVLSIAAVLIDVMSFNLYSSKQIVVLILAAIIENIGYRQGLAVWKLIGTAQHLARRKQTWQRPPRQASWQE